MSRPPLDVGGWVGAPCTIQDSLVDHLGWKSNPQRRRVSSRLRPSLCFFFGSAKRVWNGIVLLYNYGAMKTPLFLQNNPCIPVSGSIPTKEHSKWQSSDLPRGEPHRVMSARIHQRGLPQR